MTPIGWIRLKSQAWQNRRLPPVHKVRLTQKQIFIFLTKEGGLFAMMMLIIFVAGVNYANNMVLGLCFLLGSIAIVTVHHTFHNFSGLLLEAVDASDSEAGSVTQYRIRISPSGRKIPRQLLLSWEGQAQLIDQLRAPVLLNFALPTPTRGLYLPPRLTVSTVYPLGLLRAWTYVRFSEVAWVSPKPIEGILHGQTTAVADHEEVVTRVAGQEEFEDLRAFIPGESLSRVSWQHFARGQGVLTKQFSDARGREQLLDYDVMYGGHELRLSQLAYWVKRLTSEHVAFELKVRDRQLPLGTGSAHQAAALRLLAEIQ